MIEFNQKVHVVTNGTYEYEFTRQKSANALARILAPNAKVVVNNYRIKIYQTLAEYQREQDSVFLKDARAKLTDEEYNALRDSVLRESAES